MTLLVGGLKHHLVDAKYSHQNWTNRVLVGDQADQDNDPSIYGKE
jgi:hypothetical protein